jgi:hypothetical protein
MTFRKLIFATCLLLTAYCSLAGGQALRVSTSDGKSFNGIQELIFPPNSVTIVTGQTNGRSARIMAGGAGTGVPGSGLTSLNAMIGPTQTFSVNSDTNVTLNIASASNNHAFTIGWAGTLAKARQHAATVYYDQANTYTVSFLQSFFAGASNFEFKDPSAPTKKFTFDASNITAGVTRTVNVPDANSTTVQTMSAVAHNFLTGMSNQGVFTRAVPVCADLSDAGVFCSGTDAANLSGTLSLLRLGLVSGHFFVGNGSNNPADVAMSGDCTLASTGAVTCTKTSGTVFGFFATGTDASNLTGTLAAARLPTSVPTSVSNDTNVTGSIASNVLTLGWTGTLASGRLNSNVVQAITNDTNITGSISSQNLTLAWAGTLAKARQHSATVYNDQANSYTVSFLQSFFAGASNLEFKDATSPTKKFTFDASNITAGNTRTVNIPDANSTTVQTMSAVAHNFLTGMSNQGVFTRAVPVCADLSDAGVFCSGTDAANLTGSVAAARLPGSFSGFANPSASIGLSAVNGSATTAMRSDAAPALNQAITPTWTGQHTFKFSDSGTNAFTDVFTVGHNSSGTPAASFGGSVLFNLQSSTTADQNAARIGVLWTTATHASRTSAFDIQLVNNAGSLASVARFFASGGFSVNSTSDPGAGIINANSGFRVANAATSGNVLRGNGTNFVSAQLAAADLSNGTTGSGSVVLGTSPTITTSMGVGGANALGTLWVHTGTDNNLSVRAAGGTGAGPDLTSINDATDTYKPMLLEASGFKFDQGGIQVGSPTGGAGTTGNVNIAGDIRKNNTAYSNPDYVFEHWATGAIHKYADKEGSRDYRGLMPLPELERYVRENYHLPRFGPDASHGLFSGSDAMLASLEESYVHLFQQQKEIESLKAEKSRAAYEARFALAIAIAVGLFSLFQFWKGRKS